MKLSGKTALVTGSSRGIGRAIALKLAAYGADVSVNYYSDSESAQNVVGEIEKLGRRSIALKANVADPEEARDLVEKTTEQLGTIDILVNNVGQFVLKPLAAMSHEEWSEILGSNLNSVYYMCHAVLAGMRRRKQGKIINIGLSPTYLIRGAPNISAYSIAKTGVLILTRSLAAEEAPHGITVNCVSPGLIDNGYLPAAQEAWMRKRVPMGRLGKPKEVAEAVAFLASDLASYISGANLAVSGAWDWEDRRTASDKAVHELFIEPG